MSVRCKNFSMNTIILNYSSVIVVSIYFSYSEVWHVPTEIALEKYRVKAISVSGKQNKTRGKNVKYIE